MKAEIKVPSMGESITEAIIGEILKPEGSLVKEEDELLELETDKVNQVLYASHSGKVSYTVQPEDVVTIGQVIGTIETTAEVKEEKEEVKAPPPPPPPPPAKEEPVFQEGGVRVSKEAHFTEEEKPAPPPPPKKENETRRRMPKIRKLIAKRLVEVQQETAMLTTFNEVDLSEVIAIRNAHKESFLKEHGVKLGFMSFFLKACVSALKAVPDVNSYIDGDEIVHREYIDIGIAVGTERGLIVPVLRQADTLSFLQIEKGIAEFAKKAREGTISVDDLKGGGFTITNGGVYGSLLSTPILNPPQSGILGMHKILQRPIAVGNQVEIRPMMYLALSYDHRLIDGKEAVTFLIHIKEHLEDPAKLLLDS